MLRRAVVIALAGALLAGCGGGGSGSVSPSTSGISGSANSTPSPSSGATKAPTEQIAIHLKIDPSATTSSNKRHAQYVSPATNGVLVQVYTSPKSANPIPIGASATDVSPGSAACGGATGTRTCTIYIPAPAGTDDFVFTTYDQPPVLGTTTFPAGANILSIGEVTQTITLAGTNTVNAALGGVITSLAVMPVTQSALAGGASNYTLAITASDADGNAIVSGSTDPYNNPITVTASEIGGSGFTSLTLGGPSGTGSSSVTVAQSSQTVTVLYSGGGAAGYGAQFAVSSQGVPTANASFDPFFVTSTSPYYTAATAALSFSAPGQTATINLAEYGFTGTFMATAGASCASVATVSVPATGATSSATVTAGANAGSCTVTFSDGTVSAPVTVATQYTSSTITIPSHTSAIYALINDDNSVRVYGPNAVSNAAPTATIAGSNTGISDPRGIAVDSSGRIYVVNYNYDVAPLTVTVYAPNANGNVAPVATIGGGLTELNTPNGLALDPSGNIYVANFVTATVTVYAPNPVGNVNAPPIASTNTGSAFSVSVDRAGSMYVSSFYSNTVTVFPPNTTDNLSGSPTRSISVNEPYYAATDASGNLYVALPEVAAVNVYSPNATGAAVPIATVSGGLTTLTGPENLALDSSGQLYVADTGGIDVFPANLSGAVTGAPLVRIPGFRVRAIAIH